MVVTVNESNLLWQNLRSEKCDVKEQGLTPELEFIAMQLYPKNFACWCAAVVVICMGGIASGQELASNPFRKNDSLESRFYSSVITKDSATSIHSSTHSLPGSDPTPAIIPAILTDSTPANLTVIAPSPELESSTGQWVRVRSKLKTDRIYVQPQDEIWVVSARDNLSAPYDLSRMTVKKLSNGQWHSADLNQLTHAHQTDLSRKTMLFTHGNRTSYSWAVSRGMAVYQNLFSTCAARPAIRLVVFAWQSDRETPLPVADYRIKAKKSVCIGTTFGLLLNQFQNRDLMLVGYSLGAQVILSGLENEFQPATNDLFEVSLIAPAFDCDWLASRAAASRPPVKVKRATVFVNRGDRVIKVATRVCQREYPSVNLDLHQLAASGQLPFARADFVDLTAETTSIHSIARYTKSFSLRMGIYQQLVDVCRNCNKPLFVPESKEKSRFKLRPLADQ